MVRRDADSDPAVWLGKELKRARLEAGFATQEALAAHLGFDRTVVVKAETGNSGPPSDNVVAAWCQATGLDSRLFSGFAQVARRADGPVPRWFESWLDAEDAAHTLRLWQPVLVPGLLQTMEYARALFLYSGMDEDTAGQHVRVRLERQAILDRPDPPHLVTVLDEAVLHRLIGSPAVMAAELEHVASLAERPNVVVQVLPAGTGTTAGLSGGFALASVDGAPDTLRMEAVEDVTTETRALARRAATIFTRIQADALSRVVSHELIMKVAEQWKAQA